MRSYAVVLRVVVLVVLSLWCGLAASKHFDRCDLAETLRSDDGIKTSSIPDWMCLVASESRFNTAARHRNRDGSTDFGLFQINDRLWCHNAASQGGRNLCGIDCSLLLDDDIMDDMKCAKTIYDRLGMDAWYGWTLWCRGTNLAHYTRGCNL